MAHVVLFHSILGLRPVEHAIAAELEKHGHTVSLPDLFGGRKTDDYAKAFPMRKEVGTAAIMAAAKAAVDNAPATAVLAGVSFGANLIGEFWDDRPRMAGALAFAGAVPWMTPRRPGFRMSVHIARPDPFDDEAYFGEWAAEANGVALELHRYDGVGHYFLDPALADFEAKAATLCLERSVAFLNSL
jgi:dienelactone hydrolase